MEPILTEGNGTSILYIIIYLFIILYCKELYYTGKDRRSDDRGLRARDGTVERPIRTGDELSEFVKLAWTGRVRLSAFRSEFGMRHRPRTSAAIAAGSRAVAGAAASTYSRLQCTPV